MPPDSRKDGYIPMKVSKLVGERFKETPSECHIDSHALMVRGGYMKGVASGIYSQYAPLKRICQNIERIIREEMDAIDGQEVLFPVVMPGSLWEESGRFEGVGSELIRFTDRNDTPMVLGMTHEEAAVHLVREYGSTYQRYPFMIYQIQTKFRDEARPRGGLIRVREFTMKDAYSFHTSQEDLEGYYARCHKAYERIYERCGLPNVVSVASDNGMMGGKLSHEFMFLSPVGEDSLAICTACDFRANVEAAENAVTNVEMPATAALEQIATPGVSTVEALCGFFGTTAERLCKAVVYRRDSDDKLIVLFTRGDMEVNETKLSNHLGDTIYPATLTDEDPLCAGFVGPVGLDAKDMIVLYDHSLKGLADLVCGGNEKDTHCTGFSPARDCGEVAFGDFSKISEGGICPCCGKPSITLSRGIEVGNIFQLGTKYTESMGMTYDDANGASVHPIMGCYGIGVGRLVASLVEAMHDDYGPMWPMSVAPWQVQLCCLRSDNETVKAAADKLYADLQAVGISVIYDDRSVSAGFMFSDADLLGVPLRVVISPKNLEKNEIELKARDKFWQDTRPLDEVIDFLKGKIAEQMK